nr:MAG: RNA-dependent RNA polymerase [Rhizoctonia solani narnavirus 3]
MIARALPALTSGSEVAIDELVNNNSVTAVDTEYPIQALMELSEKLDIGKLTPCESIPVSPGATTTKTRKEGGFSADVRDHITQKGYRGFDTPWERKVISGITDRTTIVASSDLKMIHKTVNSKRARPLVEPDPVSVPLAIGEQGGKWRIVTKSPPGVLYSGHLARVRTFPLLKQHRATRAPLFEEELFLRNSYLGEKFLISADLSSATDLVSYDTIDKVCGLIGIDPKLVRSHTYRVGDRLIKPVRGTFMGLPPSWVVLSVSHLGICLMVDPTGKSFYLKGDDLVAWWSSSQWEEYKRLMTLAGYKINLKKSFISKDMCTFCEKGYYLRKTSEVEAYLEDLEFTSLRFLTKRHDPNMVVPRWAVMSRRFRELSSSANQGFLEFTRRKIEALAPKALVRYSNLPPAFGGLGLARKRDMSRPLTKFEEKIVNGLHDGHVVPMSPLCFVQESDHSRYIQRLMSSYRDIKKYYISPPSDLDVLDGKSIETNLITRLSYVALIKGLSLLPKQRRSGYWTERKKFFSSLAKIGSRQSHPDWGLGHLYYCIQGPYVAYDDVREFCLSQNNPRLLVELEQGTLATEVELPLWHSLSGWESV